MAYNEKLADRIRERLAETEHRIEEKPMMGGLVFMVNDKMCIGIEKDEMLCRIDPALHDMAIERTGCRSMDFTKRLMRGFVMIEDTGMKTKNDFNYWVELCLAYNSKAKSSKKSKRKKSPTKKSKK